MSDFSALSMYGPLALQAGMGAYQLHQGRKMQKALGPRVNYQIPEEARKALALYQNMAVSQTMPGQQLMQNMIDLEQSKALGQMSRVGNAQDAAGLIQSMGEEGMKQQQQLGLAAAENYNQRQQNLAGALGVMAGYKEKLNADQQQAWYDKSDRTSQMMGSAFENLFGAAQSASQMAMMNKIYGNDNDKKTTNNTTNTTATTTPSATLDPRLVPSMTNVYGSMYTPSFGMRNRNGKNPEMWDDYEQPVPLGIFSKPDLTRDNGTYRNSSNIYDFDLFNPVY